MAYGYDGKRLQVVYREPPDRSWKNIQYRGNRIRTVSFNRKNGVTTSTVKTRFRMTPVTYILAILVLFLVVAFVLRYGVHIDEITSGTRTIGSIMPTFSNFLDTVVNAPVVKPVFEVIPTVFGDWGVFNFFRDFLEAFVNVFNFVLFLAQNVFVFLEYVFYAMRWAFLSA